MRIDFAFEELPIEVGRDGYGAAYVDGVATIDYDSVTDWRVAEIVIELDKVVRYEAAEPKRLEKLCTPSRAVYQIIQLALLNEKRWRSQIETRIADDIMRQAVESMDGMSRKQIVGAM